MKEIRERILSLFAPTKSSSSTKLDTRIVTHGSIAENIRSSSFLNKMSHRKKGDKVDKKIEFSSMFEKLNSANFKTASALSGTLLIAPISVKNIVHSKLKSKYIFIRVNYGQDINIDSPSCQVSLDERKSYTIWQNYLHAFEKMEIKLNMLNPQGCVRVSVMASGIPVAKELYRIDIPVLNIFDCAYSALNHTYDAFFPLLDEDEISLFSGDWGNYSSRVFSEEKAVDREEDSDVFQKPFIRLKLKIKDTKDEEPEEEPEEEITKRWARVSVPCLSFSFVNSTKKLEVPYYNLKLPASPLV